MFSCDMLLPGLPVHLPGLRMMAGRVFDPTALL
jgi:hypothetical protein